MPRCRISFVVTSRNDDHGGDMLRRFAIFADGLVEQANRHGLAGELIVVEWNPPPGPRLHEVLDLRKKSDSFAVRFIEVPPAAHLAVRNADVIPLFQMMAKNVGIRRARGEFIVATNPDVLFSDALMAFLATGALRADVMYRLDRHDVAAAVPADASVVEQQAWCARHVLRIHGRRGSYPPDRGTAWHRLQRACRPLGVRLGYVRASLRGWRPWHIEETLTGLRILGARSRTAAARAARALRTLAADVPWAEDQSYGRMPSGLRRALAHAYILYGPHRVLRRAVWLGLKNALGPPRIHTNGCGDFTMLARTQWLRLRGYPELPLWSMHLDSFLCFMAVASGIREQILHAPCVMYHLEHGNSWVVMSSEERLRTFARKPWMDVWLLAEFWEEAYRTRRPIVLNEESWGLADWDLEEIVILSGEKRINKLRAHLTSVGGQG